MRPTVMMLILFALASCCGDKDAPKICGVDDPVNNLPWLKALIEFKKTDGSAEFRKYAYMVQAEFDGQVVFFDGNCCPNCNTFVQFYDCAGTKLNSIDFTKDYDKLSGQKIIWKPEDSVCAF